MQYVPGAGLGLAEPSGCRYMRSQLILFHYLVKEGADFRSVAKILLINHFPFTGLLCFLLWCPRCSQDGKHA